MLKIIQFLKNFLILFPVVVIFKPFKKLFLFLSYTIDMILWISDNKSKFLIENKISLTRDYSKRYDLYEQISSYYQVQNKKLAYLEFGVASGNSFKWWVSKNENAHSRFFGFDTFEGLPEDWGGFFKKGDMTYSVPELHDERGLFVKGLFQDTLTDIISKNIDDLSSSDIRIIHCDADLYSATIFALSQMYPLLRKGDIIMFDEFNVPMHEYKAFKEFTENFYVSLKPIAQVNAFYQIAFVVE